MARRHILYRIGKTSDGGKETMKDAIKTINDAITLLAINNLMLEHKKITVAEHEALQKKIEGMYL